MSNILTDLSSSPYYDDYDTTKQFYRILFIPKRGVQVREINQLQTIIQEQIRRFGNHIFKDGSVVDGCNITYKPNLEYVHLENVYLTEGANTSVNTETLQNLLVVSANTGVRASIMLAKPGYVASYPNTNRLYVNYISSGTDSSNNAVDKFQSGDTLNIYSTAQDKFSTALDANNLYNSIKVMAANVAANVSSTGTSYGIAVGDGVVYQKGYFVNVLPHTITVKEFDTDTDGMLVGFNTAESIVTHLQDLSLIDPADTTQRNGVGANRLKLNPTLVAKHRSEITDQDSFFPIVEFSEKTPAVQNTDPEYAKLGDVIAEGIYEPHGDFYIKPFTTTSLNSANTSNFRYAISAGTSYVKGDRVELLATKYLEVERATITDESTAASVTLNYGSYVLAREVLGMFDFDGLTAVSLYDAPQASISQREGIGAAATGTKIGEANVFAVLYDSGVKGTSDAVYRIYIRNINMNSGKRFSDIRSIYSAAGIGAKADLILEDGAATIKDSTKNKLVFNTGLTGLRRLRSSTGVNDTQYQYRDTSTATLQANGSVTFTLNTPHAGGNESFFASVGSLSNVNELKVDIALSEAMETAPLTGTVDSTTTGNTLIGTGTSFTTQYKPGEVIKVSSNAVTHYLRTIVSVANNTHMVLDASIAAANTAAAHRKHWVAGTILDLSDDDSSVTVESNTQFAVSLGYTIESGAPQTVHASYPVTRSSANEKKKFVRKDRYVKIDCSTAGTDGNWNLGISDVYKLEAVYIGADYSENNPDRIGWFTLDNGQKDSYYDHARLVISSNKNKITSASRILVKLSHFETSDLTGTGFYSVDSYPVRAPEDAANTTNISYADIPFYDGVDLRNCIDFRPYKVSTANSATTIADATVNPATSATTFYTAATGSYIGEPDSNFQADVEYYLPRYDLVQVDRNGNFYVKSSVPDLKPSVPATDSDAVAVAVAYVPPFPTLTEADNIRDVRRKEKVSPKLAGNRSWTMKDITGLAERINRLEYYQTLNMLEMQARDVVITDENGLNRFKNGIFADPFNNHQLGDVSNFEYSIAIDEQQSIARPKFTKEDIDYKVSSVTDAIATGRIGRLESTTALFITQPYASKFRNATESVWNWNGSLSIFPSYDHAKDEEAQPSVNVSLDLTSAWEDFANSPFGTNFGEWRTVNSSTSSAVKTASSTSGNSTTTTTTTATTTTSTLQQTVSKLSVGSTTSTIDLGSYVEDISINPYMRSRTVAFIAHGLKPNTRFYAFFDGEAVSEFCAGGTITSLYDEDTGIVTTAEGRESDVVTRTAAFGTQLVSDTNGVIAGHFVIPSERFRVGDRVFQLVNVDNIATGEDAITSAARATYTASSLTMSTRSRSLTVVEPVISSSSTSKTRVDSSTSITQRTNVETIERIEVPVENEVPVRRSQRGSESSDSNSDDPLGQSFVPKPPIGVTGIFLDKIGVYFKAKDQSLGITCLVCEMTAGVPDTTKIIASSYKAASTVTVSDDATAETVFKFDNIPYLQSEKYYAFFLRPDGNSPEYLVWMSEVGGVDITTNVSIYSNPYVGTAFTSANSTTWTALQTEDIKFNLYRCSFSPFAGRIELWDEDDDYFTVDGFAYSNTAIEIQVGDVVYTQNSTGGVLTSEVDPKGVVQFIDTLNDRIALDRSTGGFTADTVIEIHRPVDSSNAASISANTLVATATIESIDDIDYSIIVPRIGFVTPVGTDIQLEFKGTDKNGIQDQAWKTVAPETETEFLDKMRTVKSKSARGDLEWSSAMRITLYTYNSYLTPIVDLARRSSYAIKNDINNSIENEETRYGSALSKYISQPVVLADGQDAEDIKVYVTGYRPAGTNIHCYVKFLNAADTDNFVDKDWTLMEMTEGASLRSSSSNPDDYREFGFSVPASEAAEGQAYLNGNNSGIIEYSNSSGARYSGYKTFAIKLVLTSESEAVVPRMRDVRAIALQV